MTGRWVADRDTHRESNERRTGTGVVSCLSRRRWQPLKLPDTHRLGMHRAPPGPPPSSRIEAPACRRAHQFFRLRHGSEHPPQARPCSRGRDLQSWHALCLADMALSAAMRESAGRGGTGLATARTEVAGGRMSGDVRPLFFARDLAMTGPGQCQRTPHSAAAALARLKRCTNASAAVAGKSLIQLIIRTGAVMAALPTLRAPHPADNRNISICLSRWNSEARSPTGEVWEEEPTPDGERNRGDPEFPAGVGNALPGVWA